MTVRVNDIYLRLEAYFVINQVQVDLNDRQQPLLGDGFWAHLGEHGN